MANPKILNQLVRQEKSTNESFSARAKETRDTFKAQRHRFAGINKTYKPLDENADAGAQLPDDHKAVGTTALKELRFIGDFFKKAVSEAVQKEASNCEANADLTIFGNTWENVPVNALLNLESKVGQIKQICLHIPTLDDGKDWEVDNKADGTFKQTPDEWSYKTDKRPYNHVKARATDKHPEQVEVLYRDENIGKYTKRITSGAIPVDIKTRLLENLDTATKAIVAAREAANNTEIVEQLNFDALFEGIIAPVTDSFSAPGSTGSVRA